MDGKNGHRVIPVSPEEANIVMNRMNYKLIAKLLLERRNIFLENLNAKSAYWAQKRLEKLIGRGKVSRYPAFYGERMGYVFYIEGQ
jgi:ribosomal protein L15